MSGLTNVPSRLRHRPSWVSSDALDEVVVQRLLDGSDVRANSRELHAAIVTLHSWGWTGLDTARRLGCASRTVYRHLSKARAAGEL